MAPDDADDAFAATVAPPPSKPPAREPEAEPDPPPAALPTGTAQKARTRVGRPTNPDALLLESQATMAAPLEGQLPELPTVSDAHYKAEREIARGGMGKIVAAEDQRLGRPVALKQLLEPAGDALGRFQREALITARLQHPGIVPVYEAGRFPNGEPFFAMKLVSGRPLDKVIADAHTFEDRLALLPRIAAATDAIAYAHSHRIVHRDLKPGNVLVGDFGEVVVIDWGLAKDLDAGDSPESGNRLPQTAVKKPKPASVTSGSSTLTVAGSVMGTPAYMPPEQARGEQVDERADVFALGAMLYHALAGVPPYNARTATDVIAAAALGKVVPLREREPGVPADLVAIVERAMAPEAPDRYRNAGELADELRRFLTGQLVSAHEYTTLQRIGRFVKKHRAAVTISVIAVALIASGSTIAIRRIVEERDVARTQRALADARRAAAEGLIDRMLSDVKDRLEAIGRLDLLANLGGEIRDYYGTLGTGDMATADLDRMARAIELVGRAERDSGLADRAFKTWSQARAQLAQAVGADTSAATFGMRRMIAHLDFAIGTIYQQRGKSAAALAAYAKAKSEYAILRGEQPADRETLLGAADNQDRTGDLLRNDGKIDQAFVEYSDAKAARERASAQAGSRPAEDLLALSTSHLKLGSIYQARGDTATALGEYRIVLRLRLAMLAGQPDNVDIQQKVLDVQVTAAELQHETGDDKAAIATYQKAQEGMDALLRRDPSNVTWQRQRGNLFADLGFALLDSGDFKGGLEQLSQAIDNQKELLKRDPKNSSWQIDLSRSYTRAGDGFLYLGQTDDAIAHYRSALELRDQLVERDPKSAPYRRSVAFSHHKLGNAYVQKGDAAHAVEEYERALGLRRQLVAEAPTQSGFKNELASTEIVLGRLLVPRDAERARELIAGGLGRARELAASDAINNEWKETLVQGLLAQAVAAQADHEAAAGALSEALGVAQDAAARAPGSAQWPGFLAEIHAGLAAAAKDARAAAAEWKLVRELLEPLAKDGRLAAPRKPLLERAVKGAR
jgi:serine/threonine protein kinase